ncbi:MAG: hypothetical protein ACRC2K_08850 [Clostridium sp.]
MEGIILIALTLLGMALLGKVIMNNLYEEDLSWKSEGVKNISKEEESFILKVNDIINDLGEADEILVSSFVIREPVTNKRLGEFKYEEGKFILNYKNTLKNYKYKVEDVCSCLNDLCSLRGEGKRIYLIYE